jgi:ABC-type branched-subunit amino acid transport system permease subunit
VLTVLVAAPLIGVCLERLARGLIGATSAARIVATVGLLVGVQGLIFAIFGAEGRNSEAFLPRNVVSLGDINVGVDQLIVIVIGVLSTLGLSAFLRRTFLGTAMSGVVDNPELLDLTGTSPAVVRTAAWAIGSAFAALSGILLAPVVGLDATVLTLLVVQAFGAAAIGRFSSLPLTYLGGMAIGVGAALSTKYVTNVPALSGFPPSFPFIVLFVVLVFTRRGRLVEFGASVTRRATTSKPPRRPRALGSVAILAAAALAPTLAGPRLPVFTTAVVFVLMFASLRLLVVTSGQVSLCHAAFAAVGATTFSHFNTGAGVPWLFALLATGLVTIPLGAIVAIPAIRLSGLYLALATFGFGLLLERLVYPMGLMFGKTGLRTLSRPSIAGVDFSGDRAFYYFCVVAVACGVLLTYLVNHSRLGRLLRALADSPVGLATRGTNVNITRVLVFCISAFLAGVSGALLAAQTGIINGTTFRFFLSLTLLVVLAISGRGEIAAPVIGAVIFSIVPAYITSEAFTTYQPVIFGVSAIGAALASSASIDLAGRFHQAAERARSRGRSSPVRQRNRRSALASQHPLTALAGPER